MTADRRDAEVEAALRREAYKLADGSNKDELAVELLRTRAALDAVRARAPRGARHIEGTETHVCPACGEQWWLDEDTYARMRTEQP